ncbi:two-component system, OmpR family, sensor histidine kinase VicK [Methanosarcinales archaeon]|nr:ATP-binding protein [Candidatus Methanoperedens sp.]CAG1001362.1 two-component system, OmpR family, sensor histidine kinase VicK [Methanosarcinales archaeon]
MEPIRLPKLSLLAKFTIISFLITAAIAIALGWGIQQQMEQNALSQATQNTADQVSTILNQKLHRADFNGTLDPARYEEIDSLIRQNVLNKHVVRVKIWNREGLLLYSDEKEQIGQSFTDNDELNEALAGKIVSDVSPEKEENKEEREQYGRLFEVYVPLLPADSNQVAGVYEIYQDMDMLEPGIARMRNFVWGSIGLGFLVLYGSLFVFVRNASRELIHRNKENERLYEETKMQLAERQRAEKELLKRTTELESANKELEAFSYSVSHDLRAPLRAIDGFSRVMLEEYNDKLDDEGKRYLNIVRDNTQKMGQLIEDLLALSRLGRKEMQVSRIDMTKLAKTVFDEIKEANPGRNIQLEIKTLPPAYGDQAMIHQVLVNLLSNAIKFTRFKEKAVIEIGSIVRMNEIVYYVKDNGVGFDMQYLNKLFGVFQRLHSTEDFEGTGVGLAIVQRIIHRHGGKVWAEGKVNEGSTFYFNLSEGGMKK